MTDRIRAAVIGTGNIARAHGEALKNEAERVELVAAVDVEAERAAAFGEKFGAGQTYTDVDEMLAAEQPQVVLITTPPGLHAELSVAAMEAGAWVLCEKPLCASLAEMDRIEAAEARTGNYCSSIFQWRFGAAGRHVKRLIDDGVLGKLLVGTALTTWYRPPAYYAVPWRGKWATELGGVTMGHGIHAMDFLLWLMGEWAEVSAMIGTLDREIEVEDVSMAMVRFRNGAMANITNSVLSPRESSYVRLDAQAATVELTHLYSYQNDDWRFTPLAGLEASEGEDGADDSPLTQAARSGEGEGNRLAALPKDWRTVPDNYPSSHAAQVHHFLDSFARGERPEVSGPGVRGTIDFLASLYKSAMTGERVQRGSIQPGDPFYDSMCGPCDGTWQG